MALKECRECKHMVSSKAEKCPNCGAPVKNFNIFLFLLKVIFWVVVLLWKIIMYDGSSKKTKK